MKKYSTFIFTCTFLCQYLILPIAYSETITPELGDPYSQTLPLKREDMIGLSSYRRLQKYNIINNDPHVISYISYLGNRLSRNILDADRKYNFFVVQSSQINAFAIPGGFIGINSGLINLTQNEAELAGVVAHEIAHVKLRHSAEMIANSRTSSIPMWAGIIAGIFSGNAQASMAAIKAGVGMSKQMNINLIRSNETDADNYAVEIMERSNYSLKDMSNFFDAMENATGEIQRELSYLFTHPMYENRIANIESKSINQIRPISNTTEDYFYIKNILEVSSTRDINREISKIRDDTILDNHRRALLYYKKSDYANAINVLSNAYENHSNNIYIAVLYGKVLSSQKRIEQSIGVLNNIKNIYPLNRIISITLAEILIENNIKLDYAEEIMRGLDVHYELNPNYLRLASKLHTLKNNPYEASLYMSDYYLLLDNPGLAIEVLNNSILSIKLDNNQKKILSEKKIDIMCSSPRPLEPLFGEKTCN